MKNLRWRLLPCLGVFAVFSLLGVYPILAKRYGLPAPGVAETAKQLKLGLDLKGGVHLVLRVHTDDALRISTTTRRTAARGPRTNGVNGASMTVASPTQLRVEGVPQDRDAEFRRAADELVSANYDRSSGAGNTYTFTMKPNIERDMREQTVVQAQDTIDRRVNELGVAEPNISRYGQSGDQMLVQLPGVTDVNRAKEIIRSTALLELKSGRSRTVVESRGAVAGARRQGA